MLCFSENSQPTVPRINRIKMKKSRPLTTHEHFLSLKDNITID